MRRVNILAAIFVLALVVAVSTSAQTPATPPAQSQAQTGKIGWIDTGEFAVEKTGITRFVNAFKALGEEAKPRETELIGIQNKLRTIAEEISKLQNSPPNVPIDNKLITSKREEGEQLQRELEFKKKSYDAFVEKRSNELVGPIQVDIGKALQDYLKQKGYIAILDIDKLAQSGIILALEPTANITLEFIEFYNKRTPPAATAAVPR